MGGWEFAGYYSPSGRTDVGGDFYDVLSLGDKVAFFVGDVMGRGVEAAAAMAQMRATVRSYVAIDPTPENVMGKLDTMFAMYDYGQLVTLVYVLADPARDELRIVNAGHPLRCCCARPGRPTSSPTRSARPWARDPRSARRSPCRCTRATPS